MTFENFLVMLTIASVVTSLLTEGVKKFLDSLKVKYASNIVVLVTSVIVGGFGTVCYYVLCGIEWTATNVLCLFLMIVANWLCSMLGYDKVTQAITQLRK